MRMFDAGAIIIEGTIKTGRRLDNGTRTGGSCIPTGYPSMYPGHDRGRSGMTDVAC